MRLDQWLWAVRVFKTRSLAAAATRAGQVSVNSAPAKAAHFVRPGDIVAVRFPPIVRTFTALGSPPSRTSAALTPNYMAETTPTEELRRWREAQIERHRRPSGSGGRPTKRDRRDWEAWSQKG